MQQPRSAEEMQGLSSAMPIQDLQNDQQQQAQQISDPQFQVTPSHEDFFEQMISNLPSWPELPGNPKPSYDLNPHNQKLFNIPIDASNARDILEEQSPSNQPENHHYLFDDSSLLASRLRQPQMTGNSPGSKPMMLQQHLLLSRGLAGGLVARSPTSGSGGADSLAGDSGVLHLPLSLGTTGDDVNGFAGSLPRTTQGLNQQHFSQPQNYDAPATGRNQAPATGASGGASPPVKQKVRARRGQATDPHSIAERLRRERIAERMKALQELLPNANKTDKPSMLDEIVDYVKFLQLQVKVLSMSRLGGAAAVAPLVAEISSEGGGDCIQGGCNGKETAATKDSLSATEQQVAKLMEDDMGSALQYLQGKGLCLMPISLAAAISTSTRTTTANHHHHNLLLSSNPDGPSSPSMSILTVQSATIANGSGGETSVKDMTSVSKP